MKIAAIIAEYNPFHLGHEYHIEETRRITGADFVIVVMSGNYVQRGEPAICDKQIRTGMALEHGADLVLELPVVYATASAEFFATAGVKMIDELGCVDYLSFGSEDATAEQLSMFADLFLEEPEPYKHLLGQALEAGNNFPKARAMAAKGYLGDSYVDILNKSNNILGIEYIKALKRLNSTIVPVVVKRKGAGYLEEELNSNLGYPSATAIRAHLKALEERLKIQESQSENPENNDSVSSSKSQSVIFENNDSVNSSKSQSKFSENNDSVNPSKSQSEISELRTEIQKGMPSGPSTDELATHLLKGDYVTWKNLKPYLDYNILMKNSVLGKYFGMSLDLERRIRKVHIPGQSFDELLEKLHTRTLTDTALQRALLHIVLQMKDCSFLAHASEILVPYARVLGFRKEAGVLLKKIREGGQLDLIQRPVEGKNLYLQYHDSTSKKDWAHLEAAFYLYQMDIRANELYEQLAAVRSGRTPISEYRREIIIT